MARRIRCGSLRAMAYLCWSCGNEQIFAVKVGIKVGRRDSCPHCATDLHVCKNCRHWDPAIHNQCKEPEANFIRDREEANFCAHFDFRDGDAPKTDQGVEKAKAKLNDLFKNLK